MAKKVIQVPVDEELLKALDRLSRRQGRARAELIRSACLSYLTRVEQEELDRRYREGYRRIPEEPGLGEAQSALAGQILPGENW